MSLTTNCATAHGCNAPGRRPAKTPWAGAQRMRAHLRRPRGNAAESPRTPGWSPPCSRIGSMRVRAALAALLCALLAQPAEGGLLIRTLAGRGIGDRSLRDIAQAVGTSHRMLLHHFGSRSELLLAIVDEVERRQRAILRDLPSEPAEGIAAMWADVRRPELRPFERLFFECYARGAQGEEPYARMLPGAVDAWLAEVEALDPFRRDVDPALTRLGLAVVRGLLLDLVATDDDAGVDAAAQAFIKLVGRAGTMRSR